MSVAIETFIKEALTQVVGRTRCNGPGESGVAGFGVGIPWIQTHKYKKQLSFEEDAAQRGEISRDKSGMLPVEAKAATDRGPLSMAEMRLSLELAESGMSMFSVLKTHIIYGYRDGELEHWDDYTWVHGDKPTGWVEEIEGDGVRELPSNGADPMDIDTDLYWEGAEGQDVDMLDGILDSCLAVGF